MFGGLEIIMATAKLLAYAVTYTVLTELEFEM